MPDLATLLGELKRRRVVRTVLVYAAFAWAAIEVVTTLLPVFGGRETVVRVVVAVILLGLPVAVVVSWVFDVGPKGIERTGASPAGDGSGAAPSATTTEAAGEPASPPLSRPPPSPPTPLVGRASELQELTTLFEPGCRVVTVTGPGGTGKTRLAIAAAEALADAFSEGVAFVELAAVEEPTEVVPTIAAALGVKESDTRSLAAGLVTVVGGRRVLLVLDNLEQVVDAAADLARLLRESPGVHLLLTSRSPLRIAGEVEFPLRPLPVPASGEHPPLEDLETYPAVALFLDRTRRARAGFRLDADNAEAVVGICRRLDGLPLALELAAARLRTLDPQGLLERLTKALDVLTTGPRDLPERQRTLRATIDWSHSLLGDDEQHLFSCLAVFSGGFTMGAALTVAYEEEAERDLDLLESLVEKGLVHASDANRRFHTLETVREYAAERLLASGHDGEKRRRHAAYFGAFVRDAYHDARSGAQLDALHRCDAEAANVEEALEHLASRAEEGDARAAAEGLDMCGDLWLYWHIRGRHLGAWTWCGRFLDASAATGASLARGRALCTAAIASLSVGHGGRAHAEMDEALACAPDDAHELRALVAVNRSVAHLTGGTFEEGREVIEGGIAHARLQEGTWELAIALTFRGMLESALGEPDAARATLDEALALQRRLNDYEGLGGSLSGLAALEVRGGNAERGLELYREAYEAFHLIGDLPEEARVLDGYAWTALSLDRVAEAREHFADSLRAAERIGSVRGIGVALLGLAATRAAEGDTEGAVRVAAAARAFSEQEGVAMEYSAAMDAPVYLDPVRDALGAEVVERLEAEGRRLSVPEAVQLALTRRDAPPADDRAEAGATPLPLIS